MTPGILRACLAGAAAPTGAIAGDQGHELRPPLAAGRIPAAVLLGLVASATGPAILLTQRTAHLRDHAGQISLPGGRIEAADAGIEAAALREAREELGLDPTRVDLLGRLPSYNTITGFRIHPVVGWIEPPLTLTPDPFEVADVFQLPLAWAIDPRNHERGAYERDGQRREFYVLRWQDRYIWGATAAILVNFSRLLAG